MKKTLGLNDFPYSLALPVALLITVVVLFCVTFSERSERTVQSEELPAVVLLDELDARDPKEVERVVRARQDAEKKARDEAERESMRQEMISELENAGDSIWSRFRDYAVLGDSRAVGFYYYKFLQRSRVFAEGGDSIREIKSHMDELRELDPSYIYICYGLNDTGVGYWSTAEEYGEECREVLSMLKDAFPEATIVVSSTLPAEEFAIRQNPVWRKIPSFSAAMKEACDELGVVFADNDALAERYMDEYWDEDGVHLKPEFYAYWATNLLLAQIEGEGQ